MEKFKKTYLLLTVIGWWLFMVSSPSELFNYLFLIITAILSLIYLIVHISTKRINIKTLFLFLSFILTLISTIFNQSGYGKLLITLNVVVLILIINNFKDVSVKRVFLFLSLVLIFTSKKIFGEVLSTIGLNYVLNPNTIGLLIFVNIAILINELMIIKKKISIILILVIILVLLSYLIDYNSRTAYIGSGIIIVLTIFNYKVNKETMIFGIILTLAIPILYIIVGRHINNVTIFNKNLFSGRNIIWEESFKIILSNPLLGTGTSHTFGDELYTHNSSMGFLQSYGILNYILLVYLFLKIEFKNNNAKIYVISVIVMSIFEDMFFSIFLYVPVIMGLYIINSQQLNKHFDK